MKVSAQFSEEGSMSSCLITYMHDMNFTADWAQSNQSKTSIKGPVGPCGSKLARGDESRQPRSKEWKKSGAARRKSAAPRRGRASRWSCTCPGGSEGPSKTTARIKKTGADEPEDKSKQWTPCLRIEVANLTWPAITWDKQPQTANLVIKMMINEMCLNSSVPEFWTARFFLV